MNKQKIKAMLLMSPVFALVIAGMSMLLYGLYTIVTSKAVTLSLGWTKQDTKQGLMLIGFFVSMAIIFNMFEKGHKLYRDGEIKNRETRP